MAFARDLWVRLGAPIWVDAPVHAEPVALHEHDFVELTLVIGGRADQVTVRGAQPISAGCLLALQPGQWHGYAATRGLQIVNCCLSSALFERELAWIHRDPRLAALFPGPLPRDDAERRRAPQGARVLRFAGAAFAELRERFDGLQRFCARGGAAERRGELVALVLLLLERIADHADLADASGGDQRVRAACDAMAADLARAWSLDELAERAGTSASHLLRLFRRDAGRPPIEWLAERRAERLALLLVTTERSIADLGPEVGWSDPSYCARRFRACFGLAPDAYRRRHCGLRAGSPDR